MKKNLSRGFSLIFFYAVMFFGSGCGKIFDDPLEERQLNLTQLDSVSGPVPKTFILESFGHFECISCREAEANLRPFFHPSTTSPSQFLSNLVVVNYHIPFGILINDEWITEGTENVGLEYGYGNSLPQVKLNGNNSQYGFSESNVDFKNEYGPLISSLDNEDTLTFLKIVIDTNSLSYDTINYQIEFNFSASNLGAAAFDGITFKVLAVKNTPLVFALKPGEPWEVIVVEVVSKDVMGENLVRSPFLSETKKIFSVKIDLVDEAIKRVGRGGFGAPIGEPEKITNYALIILATRSTGIVENVLAYNYHPEP